MDVLRTWEGNIVLRIYSIFKKVSVVALDQNILFFIFWTSLSHIAGLLFHGRQGNKAITNFCCCLALSKKTEWLQSTLLMCAVNKLLFSVLQISLLWFYSSIFYFYFILFLFYVKRRRKQHFFHIYQKQKQISLEKSPSFSVVWYVSIEKSSYKKRI